MSECATTVRTALQVFESFLRDRLHLDLASSSVQVEWCSARPATRLCARSVLCNTLIEPNTLPQNTICAHCGAQAHAERSVFAMDMCVTIQRRREAGLGFPLLDAHNETAHVEYYMGASCLRCAEAYAHQQATLTSDESYHARHDHAEKWRRCATMLDALRTTAPPVPPTLRSGAKQRRVKFAPSPTETRIRRSQRERAAEQRKEFERSYVPFDVLAHIVRMVLRRDADETLPVTEDTWAAFVRKTLMRKQCRACWRSMGASHTAIDGALLRVEQNGRLLGFPVFYCSEQCSLSDQWLRAHDSYVVPVEESLYLVELLSRRFAAVVQRGGACYCAICVMGMVLENAIRATGAETAVGAAELRHIPAQLFATSRPNTHCTANGTTGSLQNTSGWSPLIVYDGGALVALDHAPIVLNK